MDFRAEYEKWCTDPYFDEATKAELKAIAGDDKEIEDRFYRTLEFGTAGLRGVIGAGTNRMNIYTVRQATQGLANYILSQGEDAVKRGVAIAHDSRNMHDEFTDATALCLAANGIKTYVFPQLAPVPELSYAVRTVTPGKGASALVPIILIILILAVICVDVFWLFRDQIFGKKDESSNDCAVITLTDETDYPANEAFFFEE
mgnify:CR=1 FL=1